MRHLADAVLALALRIIGVDVSLSDDDLESGDVRVLKEMIVAGWSTLLGCDRHQVPIHARRRRVGELVRAEEKRPAGDGGR